MQKLTVDELKRLLYETFCDHLTMKDIETIIMTEENHIENPEDCQVDIDCKSPLWIKLKNVLLWPADEFCILQQSFLISVFGHFLISVLVRQKHTSVYFHHSVCPLPFVFLPLCSLSSAESPTQQVKQTCVRKSLICAFAIAFIISVMLIAANQVLRSGMK